MRASINEANSECVEWGSVPPWQHPGPITGAVNDVISPLIGCR